MVGTGRAALALLIGATLAACGGAAAPVAATPAAPSPSPAPSATGAPRALVVAIRMEAPPAGRTAGDPAHAQKRAFEAAVAKLVAGRAAPGVAVELRNAGADRASLVERGEADLAMTVAGRGTPGRVAYSRAFAAGGIVLAVPRDSAVADVADLRGKVIAVAMDELAALDAAQRYLKERGVEAELRSAMGVRGAAELVATGGAVALIGDRPGILVLEKAQPGSLRIVTEIDPRDYVIAVSRSAETLLSGLDEAIAALTASGEIARAAEAAGFPYEAPR